MAETRHWLTFPERIRQFEFEDESHYVAMARIEAGFTIARLGLQGTLIGSVICVLAILAIVFSPIVLARDILTGWQLVAVVGFFIVAIVSFGAFVFDRALNLSARGSTTGVALSVATKSVPHGTTKPISRSSDTASVSRLDQHT